MRSININDLEKELYPMAIDVRESNEYKKGHIEGIRNVPMYGLLMNPNLFINKDETYYIMCQAGGRSMMVVMQLESRGYNLVNLEGGYNAYKK